MIPTAHQDLNFGSRAAQPPAADTELSPYSLSTIRLSTPLSSVSVSRYQHLPHAWFYLATPPQPEERRHSSSLGSAVASDISIIDLRSPGSAWSVLMLSEPQRDLHVHPGQGEKDPACQTLWFAPCMAQLQVPTTQLWGPLLPPSNARSSFLSLPKLDWTGAQTSARGGDAEPGTTLAPWCSAELSRHSENLL